MREREFERLYLESYSLVFNYVCYRTSDPQITEDIVAEAYLLAARSFNKFDPARSKFSTWVTTIALNCMRSYYRKRRIGTVALDDAPQNALAVQGDQDAVDDRELVMQLLGVLDNDERGLVLMKYREGMRNVDIAHRLGMNASTVSTKLANALARMRAVLKKDAS